MRGANTQTERFKIQKKLRGIPNGHPEEIVDQQSHGDQEGVSCEAGSQSARYHQSSRHHTRWRHQSWHDKSRHDQGWDDEGGHDQGGHHESWDHQSRHDEGESALGRRLSGRGRNEKGPRLRSFFFGAIAYQILRSIRSWVNIQAKPARLRRVTKTLAMPLMPSFSWPLLAKTAVPT